MKRWKFHCLLQYRPQHPNRVKQPGIQPTQRTNRAETVCLPRLLLVSSHISNQVLSDWLAPQQGGATRFSVCTGPKKREATRPQLSHMPAKVEATRSSVSAGPKQRKAARCQTNRIPEQTINVVFTKSSTAVQGDAAHPSPTFPLHQKTTTHPLSSAPHKKEAPSLLPNSTSQQSRKDQSKKPVPSLEPESDASEHSQTSHPCNKVPASAEEEIPSCFQTFPLVQLTDSKWLPGKLAMQGTSWPKLHRRNYSGERPNVQCPLWARSRKANWFPFRAYCKTVSTVFTKLNREIITTRSPHLPVSSWFKHDI